ncbi:MAG: CHRD domain-containing protein [Phycisphaerales bacterium]|nr:MAG: CHRD domain-containing protein [Phycisphaerales bacterium]
MRTLKVARVVAGALAVGLPALAQDGNGFPGRMFVFQLNGDQMVPPTDSGAEGTCFGILDQYDAYFDLGCTHNVEQVTKVEIRRAERGDVGRSVYKLPSAASPIRARWYVSPDDVADIYAGRLYVVIKSRQFRKGEIRGQVVEGMAAYHFILDGSQVVPFTPVQTQGFCVARVSADESQVALSCTHDVRSPTAAGVHRGERLQNGPEVFDLGDPDSPVEAVWDLPAEHLAPLRDSGLYVDISSPAYPDGEIRGQLVHHGECNSRETSKAWCRDGFIQAKVKKYAWLDPLDFCYDAENCFSTRTNGHGRAKMRWNNVPSGDHLVSTHYSCGETKYFLVTCR